MKNRVFVILLVMFMAQLGAQTVNNIRLSRDREQGFYEITFDLKGKAGELYYIQAIPYKSDAEVSTPRFITGYGVSEPCLPALNQSIYWWPEMEGVETEGWKIRCNAFKMPANMAFVPSGTYDSDFQNYEYSPDEMGALAGEGKGITKSASIDNRVEEWSVEVSVEAFLMGKYEVTQKEWQSVMGYPKGSAKANNKQPQLVLIWADAIEYCNKRSIKEGLKPCYVINKTTISKEETMHMGDYAKLAWGYALDLEASGYRLPTPEEWEWAAIGGRTEMNYPFAGSDDIDDVGWYQGNSNWKIHNVGGKLANDYGIYDMTGNLWEWCWDVNVDYSQETFYLLRGGSFRDTESECSISSRAYDVSVGGNFESGFRVVRKAY